MQMTPLTDICFKYLLGSNQNKDLLLSFLNAVLRNAGQPKITKIDIINPFNPANYKESKISIVDIKAEDEFGTQFNIELQNCGDSNYINRSLYYWSKIYGDQLKKGDGYENLKPCICINLLDFNLIRENDAFHNLYMIKNVFYPDTILTDHLSIHFLEFKKLTKINKRDKLILWLKYLKSEGRKEDVVKFLVKQDRDIAKAHFEFRKFTAEEKERALELTRFKEATDRANEIYRAEKRGKEEGKQEGIAIGMEEGLEKGVERGIQQGLQKGKLETKKETARKMLFKNLDLSMICEITGLFEEEIMVIKKQLDH